MLEINSYLLHFWNDSYLDLLSYLVTALRISGKNGAAKDGSL